MTITNINTGDYKLLETFISSCGTSLDTFRYFKTRPFSIIQNHLTTLLAINDNGIPVAYGHLDLENGIVWLGICVSETHLGKGYGNFMMQALMDEADRLKLQEINLTVDKNNLNAVRLY